VLKELLQRQKVELNQLATAAKAKQKLLQKLTLQYQDDKLDCSRAAPKQNGMPEGAPISLPITILERRLEESDAKLETVMNQQKTYSHICTRVNSDLQALKKTIGERQAEMKILVVEEENQSNEMNTISNKAQDAIVKLKAEIGRHVETKQGWNQQSQWARGTVALINEANQCIETQLAKRNHIIQEMDVTQSAARMERHVRMQPRLYIEALKTLRVNQHLHKITYVGSKLRQHTGINQPSKWVETITDKLSNIQTTHEGELAPSSRFLLHSKMEDLSRHLNSLKTTKAQLIGELELLKFQTGDHLDRSKIHENDARPEEKEKKLMTLEEERLTREMERRNHQRHKAQVNLKACYNNMRASQNGLVLLAERLDAIPLLGPPLQAAGRADDDGMLPAASLQHMLNHLLLRFSRLVELQSVVTQHQDQLSQHAAGTAEAAEAHATFDERMRQLAVQPPAAVVTTTPLTPPRPSSVTSLPSSSQHSRPSSTQSNMLAPTAALGEEQSLLTVREAALHDDASSPIAHPLPSLTSHVATTPVNCSVPIPARPRRSMRSNNSTKQLLSQPPSKGYMNGLGAKDLNMRLIRSAPQDSDSDSDDDDIAFYDGYLTREEVKFGKEPPPKTPTALDKGRRSVSSQPRTRAEKAKMARAKADPSIRLTVGWRGRTSKKESNRPAWDLEPAWEGEELLLLDARGRLQNNLGATAPPAWKDNPIVRGTTSKAARTLHQ